MSQPDTTPAGQTAETLICPNCQKDVVYYDRIDSYYYGCPHCHQFFDYEQEGPPVKLHLFGQTPSLPLLRIGQEGFLRQTWVRVVGYLYRKEQEAPDSWGEYVLLDRDGNHSMLAEYNGHWTLIMPDKGQYDEFAGKGKARYVDTPDRQYRLFHRYRPETLYAVGEFDWNILADKDMEVSEYIHPPFSLTHEQLGSQSDWYTGEYIQPADIAAAFGLNNDQLPTPHGIGASQPSPVEQSWPSLKQVTLYALLALFILQVFFSLFGWNKAVYEDGFTADRDTSAHSEANSFKPFISPAFTVTGPTLLEFTFSSPLDNQWLELPVSVVHEESGKAYTFTKALEYYYGVDGGEHWSEGDRKDDAYLSGMPSGRYHLNIYPYSGSLDPVKIHVAVRQKTPIANLFLIAGLLLVYPLFQYARQRWFDYSRWSNSDYSDIEES
ncbi:DUF4178 domain-containing protein [Arsenicibacter rosenii]|uniref:DUF4178 domain-containing protein n=1 Tax=Arsenicibacter rosenii TaxID=1750698 RepID=A0A1S2VPI8_9BACT|nr:DUF4178 domain-containing protein [Arsenicibacter rosenii]OIN59708.1 hypothetical protein BLX24_07525 [Arsenicibacter rosenii]